MNVLIYGSNGWIGNQFKEILDENFIKYTVGKSRVNNIDDLKCEINRVQPTNIISFIGRTHGTIYNKEGEDKVYTTIDYLEQKGKIFDNVRDNLYSPLALAIICKENNIHYTYLGTGCIFKYNEEHPYGKEINGFTENSLPNFFGSSYSTVKGFTDQLMHFFNSTVLNLRIRMPITEEMNERNFITKITNYKNICSIPNSMTVLPELLPKVLDMMKKNIIGTLNLTNPGLISHNEILKMFKEIVDPNFVWNNFTIEEQGKVIESDRSNNYLDTSKLESMYPDVKYIKDSVRDCLIKYKKTYKVNKEINSLVKDCKCLFVTGGAGFIGSNFINIFAKEFPDIKIINFDALYYCANKNNISEEIINSKNYTFIEGNLQSYDLLKYIFNDNNITHIIHFAAQSHVQNSFTDALQYTKDNIVGTHNLLEVTRLHCKNLIKFIHVSTDEVYGESMIDNTNSKTEHSILCPTNPYAATKASAELIAQSYNHSFKMPIIITRGNNVYGPNQYPEKVIPRFILQLKNREKITIQGDGSCIRAFLHSSDTASAFITILDKGTIGEIYNIGCDDNMEYSIMDIGKMLIKKIIKTDEYDSWIEYIEDRPFNDQRYYISNSKLKNLGWTIKKSFEDGINELVE